MAISVEHRERTWPASLARVPYWVYQDRENYDRVEYCFH